MLWEKIDIDDIAVGVQCKQGLIYSPGKYIHCADFKTHGGSGCRLRCLCVGFDGCAGKRRAISRKLGDKGDATIDRGMHE